MTTFSERLREERLRLNLNQADFGAIGGVQKDAQLKYEAGKRKPDADYLTAIAAAGVDVTYVLTGTRVMPVVDMEPMPMADQSLYVGWWPADPSKLKPAQRQLLGILEDMDEEGEREILEDAQKIKRGVDMRRELAALRRQTGHGQRAA